jgi:hypothetical protein
MKLISFLRLLLQVKIQNVIVYISLISNLVKIGKNAGGKDSNSIVSVGIWWHGCAATQSGTEQVQDIYTVFELAYIIYKNKVGLTQCTET